MNYFCFSRWNVVKGATLLGLACLSHMPECRTRWYRGQKREVMKGKVGKVGRLLYLITMWDPKKSQLLPKLNDKSLDLLTRTNSLLLGSLSFETRAPSLKSMLLWGEAEGITHYRAKSLALTYTRQSTKVLLARES
jgi:hypothetical protein